VKRPNRLFSSFFCPPKKTIWNRKIWEDLRALNERKTIYMPNERYGRRLQESGWMQLVAWTAVHIPLEVEKKQAAQGDGHFPATPPR
jgi:hypothetical protein